MADAAEIKAAFRYQAKLLHPDRNVSDEATQQFQRVAEAYRVLRNARTRRSYDATTIISAPGNLIDPTDQSPEPLACSRCGKVTAQPRYLIFRIIRGTLLSTRKDAVLGIFCRDCADRTAIRASTATWLCGWWSPTGPYHTVRALFANLKGGEKPRADNLWVILHQARAFLARGEADIARALAEQAEAFAGGPEERAAIAAIVRAAGGKARSSPRLKNRWRPWSYAPVVQALPLAALVVGLGVAVAAVVFRTETDSASAAIIVRPAQAGEIRHVAVDLLKVRQGPNASQPVVALVDRFATVQVMDSVAEGEWARILTANGVTGYVPARFLFGGPGNASKNRWCADQKGEPPANGEVLLRRTGGEHRLTVKNTSGHDAVVRLKTPTGRTLMAFYIDAGANVSLPAIPDGTFRAVFASGRDYSRACGIFLENMQTFIVPTAQVIQATMQAGRQQLALTLPPVGDGPGESRTLPLESFLDN
ncbi:MAG TPA: DnaJ domain-containing protein [Rhodospirillaceae bacterium]|nr:DnaJ domain-containing protein [Rhodospirillaceae bacterium]